MLIVGLPSISNSPIGAEALADGPIQKTTDVFISYRRSNGSQLARYVYITCLKIYFLFFSISSNINNFFITNP